MNIEYQSSPDSCTASGPLYIPCEDRADEFIGRAAAHNNVSAEDVLIQLRDGKLVEYSRDGLIRDSDIARAQEKDIDARLEAMRCERCGTPIMHGCECL